MNKMVFLQIPKEKLSRLITVRALNKIKYKISKHHRWFHAQHTTPLQSLSLALHKVSHQNMPPLFS